MQAALSTSGLLSIIGFAAACGAEPEPGPVGRPASELRETCTADALGIPMACGVSIVGATDDQIIGFRAETSELLILDIDTDRFTVAGVLPEGTTARQVEVSGDALIVLTWTTEVPREIAGLLRIERATGETVVLGRNLGWIWRVLVDDAIYALVHVDGTSKLERFDAVTGDRTSIETDVRGTPSGPLVMVDRRLILGALVGGSDRSLVSVPVAGGPSVSLAIEATPVEASRDGDQLFVLNGGDFTQAVFSVDLSTHQAQPIAAIPADINANGPLQGLVVTPTHVWWGEERGIGIVERGGEGASRSWMEARTPRLVSTRDGHALGYVNGAGLRIDRVTLP